MRAPAMRPKVERPTGVSRFYVDMIVGNAPHRNTGRPNIGYVCVYLFRPVRRTYAYSGLIRTDADDAARAVRLDDARNLPSCAA